MQCLSLYLIGVEGNVLTLQEHRASHVEQPDVEHALGHFPVEPEGEVDRPELLHYFDVGEGAGPGLVGRLIPEDLVSFDGVGARPRGVGLSFEEDLSCISLLDGRPPALEYLLHCVLILDLLLLLHLTIKSDYYQKLITGI